MYHRRDSRGNTRKAFAGGQLKITAKFEFDMLHVCVDHARHLLSKSVTTCDVFVRIGFYSEDHETVRFETHPIPGSSNPVFKEKISIKVSECDFDKRLLISLCHRLDGPPQSKVIGCMSFGLQHLAKRELQGWFHLLTDDVGRKRHVPVSGRPRTISLGARGIPAINTNIKEREEIPVTVGRGKNGFGFSVIESCPAKVDHVVTGSPAECSGLQTGDVIIRVNGLNVSRSTSVSVSRLIKCSSDNVILVIKRSSSSSFNTNVSTSGRSDEVAMDTDDCEDPNQAFLLHTSPVPPIGSPLLCSSQPTVYITQDRKRTSIRQLLDAEMDFVDFMHRGMQLFSRPLRCSFLKSHQYVTLFQNIEKLVTISEYFVKQLYDKVEAESDDISIGHIYQSKIDMLEEAYTLYLDGFGKSVQFLSDLRKSDKFRKFIRKAPSCSGEPSISGFLFKPIMHIQTLHQNIQDISANSEDVFEDSVSQVAQVLDGCIYHINNNDTTHVSRSDSTRTSFKSFSSFRSIFSRGSSFLDTGSMGSGKSGKSGISLAFLRMS